MTGSGPRPDQLARRIAAAIHRQFVVERARSAPIAWSDAADAEEARITRFVRSLSAEDRTVLATLVARVAADALISVAGLLDGTYGLGRIKGREGLFVLTYDGANIGEPLKDHLLELEAERIESDDARQ